MEGAFRPKDVEEEAEAEVEAEAASAVPSALLSGSSWYVAMDRQTANARTRERILRLCSFV